MLHGDGVSRRAGLTAALIVAGLLAVFFGARAVIRAERGPVGVGTRAPNFAALTLDTALVEPRTKTLADYRGEVVLLNVWATWCTPCRVEMPSMQKLHESFAERGLRVVAVSVDDPGMEEAIREFAKEYGLTFEILHDASGAIKARYHTTGLPESAVIGRDGTIRKRVAGADDWNSAANRALVERLLGETRG
jgi:cytochrome c biogenesis protein CcmG, thiol:disulfide interchange protein DsbE